ncbi:hypothetical protein LC605_27775 [Nostoc sp. CHAB 5836]|uniref:hypothetical protein n=1 Tax=Nostoc sp. CHAB 5836 TaxID=2780404 RepID=UPI001E5823C1|nr:hypothetical protein [Nostoc sp. CHAB 5836]MCC5618819.1 hypothetical protein [Nostoc sp. CHAB 5836]
MANLRVKKISAILVSLTLVTGFGAYVPAYALPNCDANPDAPRCGGGGDPKPKPTPRPKPNPVPTSPIVLALLEKANVIQQVIDISWTEFGKGIAAQQIKDELSGKQVGKILFSKLRLKNVNVNLRDLSVKQVTAGPGPNQISVRLVAPNNNVNASVSVPLSPDPSYRVFFDIEVDLKLTINNSSNPIKLDELSARSTNAFVQGSNLVGTITKFFGDFFTGGGFSKSITNRANQNISKDELAASIQSITDRFRLFAGI